jgi:hypothetical protein
MDITIMEYLREDTTLVITSCIDDEEPLKFTAHPKCNIKYKINDLFKLAVAKNDKMNLQLLGKQNA